jgi:hypothetical protein
MAADGMKQLEALLKKGGADQRKGVKAIVEAAMDKKDVAATEKFVNYGKGVPKT